MAQCCYRAGCRSEFDKLLMRTLDFIDSEINAIMMIKDSMMMHFIKIGVTWPVHSEYRNAFSGNHIDLKMVRRQKLRRAQ